MAKIEMIDVRSSTISSIGYDYEEETLVVEFKPRSKYEYYNVPQNLFDSFLNAPSKGKFLGKYIKDRFRFKKIK